MVKTLANGSKFRTACFTSLCDLDGEKKKLRLGADVVISTPGRLLQLLKNEEINLSELRVMVLDEADVLLLDESFPLQPIGQACKHLTDNISGDESASNIHRDVTNSGSVSVAKNSSSNGKLSKSKTQSAANNTAPSLSAPSSKLSDLRKYPTAPASAISSKNSALSHSQTSTQFLFVTATLPEVVVSQIVSEFPEVMTLKDQKLLTDR